MIDQAYCYMDYKPGFIFILHVAFLSGLFFVMVNFKEMLRTLYFIYFFCFVVSNHNKFRASFCFFVILLLFILINKVLPHVKPIWIYSVLVE